MDAFGLRRPHRPHLFARPARLLPARRAVGPHEPGRALRELAVTTPGRGELLAVAHAAPFQGQAMAGFVLAGVLAVLVLLAGAFSANAVLAAWGAGACVAVGIAV